MRPSMHEIYMNIATDVARRSTCSRASVGCIMVSSVNGSILAFGYNGGVRGDKNTCDRPNEVGNCGCTHSEINCISQVGTQDKNKIIYLTLSPCEACSKVLINAGCSAVYFKELYRIKDHLNMFLERGIRLYLMEGNEPKELKVI